MSKWNGDKARHFKHAKRRALLRLKGRTLRETLAEKAKPQGEQPKEKRTA
ncbi:MAG TPA: hypothetical protein VG649_08845 [Candidatus Angelobacter sp.]|nr:hypothetical protein [Candidatus Angelobacter sp.]